MDCFCPYCENLVEINHDDGYGYEEGVAHQQDCPKCGKVFVYHTAISFDYDATKADCLNGGEHEYEPVNVFPPEFSFSRCKFCDEKLNTTGI